MEKRCSILVKLEALQQQQRQSHCSLCLQAGSDLLFLVTTKSPGCRQLNVRRSEKSASFFFYFFFQDAKNLRRPSALKGQHPHARRRLKLRKKQTPSGGGRPTSPEPLAVADFAAHALVLAQAAQEADLGGEDAVVGDLEQQLLTWDQRRRGVRTFGRRSPHRFSSTWRGRRPLTGKTRRPSLKLL